MRFLLAAVLFSSSLAFASGAGSAEALPRRLLAHLYQGPQMIGEDPA